MVSVLARSDALIVRKPGALAAQAGDAVEILAPGNGALGICPSARLAKLSTGNA